MLPGDIVWLWRTLERHSMLLDALIIPVPEDPRLQRLPIALEERE